MYRYIITRVGTYVYVQYGYLSLIPIFDIRDIIIDTKYLKAFPKILVDGTRGIRWLHI